MGYIMNTHDMIKALIESIQENDIPSLKELLDQAKSVW